MGYNWELMVIGGLLGLGVLFIISAALLTYGLPEGALTTQGNGMVIACIVLIIAGSALTITGFLIILLSAFEEDIITGFMFLFLPFYAFYYAIALYESKHKDRVIFTCIVGLLAVAAGICVYGINLTDTPAILNTDKRIKAVVWIRMCAACISP